MRILFSSLDVHGHTYPLIPLALAARDAGHDVLFATGEAMVQTLRSAGLATAKTGGLDVPREFGRIMAEEGVVPGQAHEIPEEVHVRIISEIFGSMYPRALLSDLAPIIERHRPDLVIQETGNPGAGLAAKLAGVPNVIHPFGRGSATAAADPFQANLLKLADEVGAGLSADEPALGLATAHLDIFPPSLQDKAFIAEFPDRILLRPVPFAPPGELPAGVTDRGGRPLVYLTLGTAFADPRVLRAAILGLSTLDAVVIVATGPAVDVAHLGPLPDGVELHSWIPQAELLPHADLIVHHGGAGTTLGALGSGVPQLFLPQGVDHFVNSAVVSEAGAGRMLTSTDVTEEAVAEQARQLLASGAHRQAAVELSQEIAKMPSPAEIAARLPELAG